MDTGVAIFPEHTHIPASRLSPWPGDRELPRGPVDRAMDTFEAAVAEVHGE